MSDSKKGNKSTTLTSSSNSDIRTFIQQAKDVRKYNVKNKSGRLIFALDATASRQPTWDIACQLQGDMFEAADSVGHLQIQLCYFRGFKECQVSRWLENASQLHNAMNSVHCVGGRTQIERILLHALAEYKQSPVKAVAFVGDCVEENIDVLTELAGKLGLYSVPVFTFHEGHNLAAERAFKEIARLSGGVYCHFDPNSAQKLRELLMAVAVYATGGSSALQKLSQSMPQLESFREQIKPPD